MFGGKVYFILSLLLKRRLTHHYIVEISFSVQLKTVFLVKLISRVTPQTGSMKGFQKSTTRWENVFFWRSEISFPSDKVQDVDVLCAVFSMFDSAYASHGCKGSTDPHIPTQGFIARLSLCLQCVCVYVCVWESVWGRLCCCSSLSQVHVSSSCLCSAAPFSVYVHCTASNDTLMSLLTSRVSLSFRRN